MQKKLLLLCMVVSCATVRATEVNTSNIQKSNISEPGYFDESMYMDEFIAQYAEIYSKNKFATPGAKLDALKKVYDNEENNLKTQRNKKDSHQCNGWHIAQPDKNCVTGSIREALDKELAQKSLINNELYAEYNNGFGLAHTIDTKIFLMGLWEDALGQCGIDNPCLRKYGALRWEELSALNFFEEQDSAIYADAIYKEKMLLTRDQKLEAVKNDEELKSLIVKYDDAKKKLKERIDFRNPEKKDKISILDTDIKEDQNDQGALSQ